MIKPFKRTFFAQVRPLLLVGVCVFGIYIGPTRVPVAHASVIDKAPTSYTNLNSGLVGYWTFDGKDMSNGVALDKSGNSNNGNLINIATSTFYSPGKIGQAFNFDGVDDYLTGPAYNGVKTVSFWMKPNTTTQTILSLDAALASTSVSSGTISANNFTSPTIYVDGVVSSTIPNTNWHFVTITTGMAINASAITIGKTAAGYYNGLLDSVRIYNRVLSAAEVKQLYDLGQVKVNKTPTTNTDINSGMLGWWTFDGKDTTSTTANDISGKGLTATLQEIILPKTIAGKIGQAMDFDGANNYATIVSNPLVSGGSTMSTPNSICAWAYMRNPLANGSGAWDQTILNFMTDTSNGVRFSNDFGGGGGFVATYRLGGVYYGQQSSTVVFKKNTWANVCYTWNGSTVLLYANGVALAGATSSNSLGAVNTIAARDDLYDGMWNGSIDDIRVYSRALTPAEIRQVYNQGVSTVNKSPTRSLDGKGLSSGLVGYWTFDGRDTPWTSSSAATTLDKSGNGHTGTLAAMTQSTSPVPGKIGQGLKFDGMGTSIELLSMPVLTERSISMWIYPKSPTNSYGTLLAESSTKGLFIRGTSSLLLNAGKLDFYTGGQDTQSTGTVGNNAWHHIAYSWDSLSNTSIFYIDGVQAGTVVGNPPGTTFAHIGSGVGIGLNFYGDMDDVRLYNRALSATEVRQLYNMGR